jgi:CO/xanthine dehydrogenase Mo-binding subunit/CO/xanthine dehydrogenase FAD-binding subunit
MTYIGRRVRSLDWDERTSGRSRYSADLRLDGLLVGRILRSPHPFARILSIDTSLAVSMPGVHAVITARDFPSDVRYQHEGAADRTPLAEDIVRFIGQEIAAVAAETPEQAAAALQKIRVRYATRSAPLTTDDAVMPGSTRLHDRKASEGTPVGNVSRRLHRDWGDAVGGRAESVHSVAGSFRYPRVTHACMEPNTTLASWSESEQRMHLWTSTQSPYFVVKELAHVLNLPETSVFCHEVAVGGGFGSKSKIGEHEAIAALLSRTARRPVRIALLREEEFAFTKSRHAFSTNLQIHADSRGRIRSIDGSIVVDNGAYDHSGVSVMSAGLKAFGMMYRPLGIRVDAELIDTAVHPGGAFRGYGSTQTGFALECLIDELAEKAGIDPLELRLRNANRPAEKTLVGAELSSVRLAECLEAVREAIGWKEEKKSRKAGRGVGVAAAVHPSGVYAYPDSNRSDAAVDIFADGRIRVRFGGADAGTGQRTILAQIAAQELNVDIDRIEVVSMDSETTPFDMGAWSSRGTHYGGHAVRLAAKSAAERMGNFAVAAVDGVLTAEASFVETKVRQSDPKTGIGNYSASYNFAAHAALVEVDRRTGHVKVLDYVAAHDSGTAINPTFLEGQIVGGVVMGLGAALGEELIYEQGKVVNPAYLHYALPRAADVPRIRPILVDGGDANGPYGAKGAGELGINPPGPAIANAVYDAIGVRIRDLPITPDKIITALAEKEGRGRYHQLWRRPGRWWIQLVRWAYHFGLLSVLHRLSERPSTALGVPAGADVEIPEIVEDALQLLASDAMPIAGGTDVALQRRQGLVKPVRLVSLTEIPQLRSIEFDDDGSVSLGATATLADVAEALRSHTPAVAHAIDTIASSQIRAMATVGGNLLQAKRCWFYRNDFPCYKRVGGKAPCYAINGDHRFYHAAMEGHRCQAVTPSDLATILVALGANVVVQGPLGERMIPLASFYTGPGETLLGEEELLIRVVLPAQIRGRRSAFEKLRLWEGDFALVSAAISAQVDGIGRWHDLRIVLGAIAPMPWRATETERSLEGSVVTSQTLRAVLDRELDAKAHPLPRNGWKLDAVAGLTEKLVDRLLG